MFDIFDKNVIRIVRGNSASINITPIDTDTSTPVILSEGDKVLFTVKNQNGATVMQKVLTSANYDDGEDTSLNCPIEPDDTIDLLTGEYAYDCLLLVGSQAVTFISSALIIEKALGTYEDVSGGDEP
jgi:hypothetical protein